MSFTKEDVSRAIDRVCADLSLVVDEERLGQYERGLFPNLLSYEKVGSAEIELPAIQKVLFGTRSFLDQPIQYYDIFKACRHVILIRALERALKSGMLEIDGAEQRLGRLKSAGTFDEFESVLFEVLVGAGYARVFGHREVAFVEETPELKSPDIRFFRGGREHFAECKKFDRTTDYAALVRDVVRSKLQPVLRKLNLSRISVVAEVTFAADPVTIADEEIEEAILRSIASGNLVKTNNFKVRTFKLSPIKFEDYVLYPSPKYLWERYGYRVTDQWFGIVNTMEARQANCIGRHLGKELGQSSWLDDVAWEAAVKWKVEDSNVIRNYKKLAFNRIFKGVAQINERGGSNYLHFWFDRDHAIGPRREVFDDLVQRMERNAQDQFASMIFNESVFDVSPKGNFDLIEHAHIINGPNSTSHPPVTNVFVDGETIATGPDLTGIGVELLDVDELSI